METEESRKSAKLESTKRACGFSAAIPYEEWEEKKKILEAYDNLSYYIGQRELSAEGFDHIQLLIVLKVKRALGVFLKQCVLELQSVEMCENIWKTASYAVKKYSSTDEIVQYGPVPKKFLSMADKDEKPTRDDMFSNMLACETRQEALDYVRDNMTSTYVLQNAAICAFVNKQFATETQGNYTLDQFRYPKLLVNKGKTYIFVGPAGIGKTQYALAHFSKPLLVSDRQDLSKLSSGDYDGIVFDDMNFNKWNCCNVIHLVDQECDRTINVKYGSVAIPAGMPRIITLNTLDNFWPENMNDAQKPALSRRIQIRHFNYKLFIDPKNKDAGIDQAIYDEEAKLTNQPSLLRHPDDPTYIKFGSKLIKESELKRSLQYLEQKDKRKAKKAKTVNDIAEKERARINETWPPIDIGTPAEDPSDNTIAVASTSTESMDSQKSAESATESPVAMDTAINPPEPDNTSGSSDDVVVEIAKPRDLGPTSLPPLRHKHASLPYGGVRCAYTCEESPRYDPKHECGRTCTPPVYDMF